MTPDVSLVDRIPPSNLEAEMALLGSVLVDKEMMAAVCEIVRPSDFYASLHETIYLALFALYESGKPLDKVALAEELRSRGMLEKVGGLAYISKLMETVPTAASAEYYAKIVREKASLRGLIHAGTRITQLGYESEHDVPAALAEASEALGAVAQPANRSPWLQLTKSAADIAAAGVPAVEFDIAGILEARDGPVLMFGDGGSFKSWTALFISAAILNGAPFLGRETRQRPSLLYNSIVS